MTTQNTRLICGRGQLRLALSKQLKAVRPRPSKVLVVMDRNARAAVGKKLDLSLRDVGIDFQVFPIAAAEQRKTMESAQTLASKLVLAGADRKSFLLAVGGGVSSDLAGFVAANLLRGIRWGIVPTTLLAMADASIGGKTAVNLPQGKNLFGAFHMPRFVVSDVLVLRSLRVQDWRCGLGEILKTAMLSGPSMFQRLLKIPASKLRKPSAELSDLLTQCARFKQKVVQKDPEESGERKLLNLGHTFGHAMETAAGPRNLAHGEAVALGLICALHFSEEQGLCQQDYAVQVLDFLQRNGMKTVFPKDVPTASSLRKLLQRDKKGSNGKLELILPVKPGANLLVSGVNAQEVALAMRRVLP